MKTRNNMIQKLIQELIKIKLIKKPILRINELDKLENMFLQMLKKEKQETIKKLEKELIEIEERNGF